MRLRFALLLTLAFLSAAAIAAPASYYWWQGKHTTICAQTSPGKGWVRISGAFVKADCSI
ncbi:hypothetical protein ACIQAL_27765 [Pseudomonas sp. NPDC088368]|jgi:hypothetical protein|uniref:hypothetical protein n=1 Tax=Pseudomonas sp. NPDC088368 TaxID=3364453 RepID=UPI00382EB05B